MLNVNDNSTGLSYAYIRKDFGLEPRANVALEFELTPNLMPIRDVYIALMRGTGGIPLTGIVVGEDRTLKLKNWHYNLYPSKKLYPGKNTFPKGTRRTFPPFYPSSNIRPDQKSLFPPFLPPKYPTIPYSGEKLNYYPGNSQPKPKTVVNVTGKTYVNISVSNYRDISSEVHIYAERIGGRGRNIYSGILNWKMSSVKTVDLGCIYANNTPYNFSFESIYMSGDVPSEDWYLIRDYEGFSVAEEDEDVLWEGSLDTEDPTTYSEPTRLENLARYDYARTYNDSPLSENPKGVTWIMS